MKSIVERARFMVKAAPKDLPNDVAQALIDFAEALKSAPRDQHTHDCKIEVGYPERCNCWCVKARATLRKWKVIE
jgi:hypothetical protein